MRLSTRLKPVASWPKLPGYGLVPPSVPVLHYALDDYKVIVRGVDVEWYRTPFHFQQNCRGPGTGISPQDCDAWPLRQSRADWNKLGVLDWYDHHFPHPRVSRHCCARRPE